MSLKVIVGVSCWLAISYGFSIRWPQFKPPYASVREVTDLVVILEANSEDFCWDRSVNTLFELIYDWKVTFYYTNIMKCMKENQSAVF